MWMGIYAQRDKFVHISTSGRSRTKRIIFKTHLQGSDKPSHATVPLKVWPGSGYAWNNILEQIEMFCFCSNNKQTKSKCFGFVPIISFDIERFVLSFQYQSLLSEQNQNVLIWSAYYRNKSRTFQSVPKLIKIEL